MSIATEITRIQGAKANLKTSIEAKGVAVPSATLISGYAALVDQIQEGGGLPDSDGLVGLAISNGDMSDSSSSLTLTYTPTYLLRYTPPSPISHVRVMDVSTTVVYPSVVWTCSSPSITISGNKATIPTGTDSDVVFTATWTDYNGEVQTTSKTIHMMNLAYRLITIYTNIKTSLYFVTNEWPDNIGVTTYETYRRYYICKGPATTTSYGYKVLSNNGTSAAIFDSVDAAKAAIDSM